jgi:MFS family permease
LKKFECSFFFSSAGFTFAGIWSVFTKYLCANVPSEYLGTLQGFLHGVYWGLGSGTGHMIGGISVETLGARVTFWIFAGASFFNLLLFIIVQKVRTNSLNTSTVKIVRTKRAYWIPSPYGTESKVIRGVGVEPTTVNYVEIFY